MDGMVPEKSSPGRRPLVFLVDDEPMLREITGEILAENHFEVVALANGNEALQMIRTRMPDVLITDLRMSRGSGEELLRELAVRAPGLPVIVCSGLQNLRQDVLSLPRARPLIFHDKPVDLDRLINDIRSILGGLC